MASENPKAFIYGLHTKNRIKAYVFSNLLSIYWVAFFSVSMEKKE